MKVMVAAIQMVSTNNLTENLRSAEQCIKQAVKNGAELIVLPESFAFLGRFDEEWSSKLTLEIQLQCTAQVSQWAREYSCWIVSGTLPFLTRKNGSMLSKGRYKATCGLVNPDGMWVDYYEKYHLFRASMSDGQRVYDESIRYESGSEWVVADSPWGSIGMAVCFDLRFSEQFLFFREQDVKCVVLPSAFTEETGRYHWELLVRARAIEYQLFMIAANQGGDHGGKRKTWGHSMIVDPWGRVINQVEKGEAVVSALIDFDEVERVRQSIPMSR